MYVLERYINKDYYIIIIMFNSKNFPREIFCRSREIFDEAGSFDNYKAPTIML